MLLFLFMMAHRPEYAPQSVGVRTTLIPTASYSKQYSNRELFSPGELLLAPGVYTYAAVIVVGVQLFVYVASLFGHL